MLRCGLELDNRVAGVELASLQIEPLGDSQARLQPPHADFLFAVPKSAMWKAKSRVSVEPEREFIVRGLSMDHRFVFDVDSCGALYPLPCFRGFNL